MTYPDQHRKPSWIDDDNWTSDKTEWEFRYLLDQHEVRDWTPLEKEWILTLIPNFIKE